MIKMQDLDEKFIEDNKDFLEAVQDAIKVGVSINLPSGLNQEPEVVTRFKTIEHEVKNKFDPVQTLISIPGLMLQFLFCSMDCIITCMFTEDAAGNKNFNLHIMKLTYKATYFPKS